MFMQRVPAAIFTGTFMRTLLTAPATANWNLMALIYMYTIIEQSISF